MRKETLKQLERALCKRRRDCLERISGKFGLESARWTVEAAENAQTALQVDIGLAVAEGEAEVVSQIDEALARMQKGTYGRCEVCGKVIPLARLRAVPFTAMCVQCKSEEERHSGRTEPRYLSPIRAFPAPSHDYPDDEDSAESPKQPIYIKGRRRAGTSNDADTE